uniref:Chitin-binding type-2 domain-containing protein n=1 Tax=Timema monikensis TaxID=170555 RepID=A0A7R9E2A1_9NEOP|nr:unnamed protein product [Timema monikensis]
MTKSGSRVKLAEPDSQVRPGPTKANGPTCSTPTTEDCSRDVTVEVCRPVSFRRPRSDSYVDEPRTQARKPTLSTPNRDANLDIPVNISVVYCESSALDHAATEMGGRVIPVLVLVCLIPQWQQTTAMPQGIADVFEEPSIGPSPEPEPQPETPDQPQPPSEIPIEPTTSRPEVDFICPHQNNTSKVEYHPNLKDCQTYYECDNMIVRLLHCAEGTWFNSELEVCTFPHDSGCIQPESLKKSKSDESENIEPPPFQCPHQTNGSQVIYYPNPENCETYFECDNTVLRLIHCANGTWYSSKLNVCTFPHESDCTQPENLKKPDAESIDSKNFQSSAFQCPHQTNGSQVIYYQNPQNCATYFECDNTVLRLIHCAVGTWYNSELHVCTFPYESGCTQTESF